MAYKIYKKPRKIMKVKRLRGKRYRLSNFSQYPFLRNLFGDKTKRKSNVGKVYRGTTKYIDKDTKPERNYVVVKDNGKFVSVSKLKSVKKDNDEALFEIDFEKYGLAKRTGVDYQRFDKNRMSKKPLSLEDRKVFPEGQERFKLSSHDTYKAIRHTQKKKKPR